MGKPCSMALIGLVMMWPFQFVDLAFFCARTSTSAAWQVLRVFTGFPSGAIRTLNLKLRLGGDRSGLWPVGAPVAPSQKKSLSGDFAQDGARHPATESPASAIALPQAAGPPRSRSVR